MSGLRHALGICTAGALALSATAASGQAYPNKSIRIVTADAGGSADFFARILSQELVKPLGQTLVVENKAGSGVIPGENVARATPDGYTLLFQTNAMWINPLLQKTAYDPVNDFAPITIPIKACSMMVVSPTLPVNSVKEFIALAKAKPGEINYAHGSPATASHLAGYLFQSMAGINMLFIPYKGTVQALTDIVSGRVQAMFPNVSTVSPYIKSGRVKALATTCLQPSSLYPELPTVSAAVPGFDFASTSGLFAPAKTPDAIIRRLNQEVVRIVHTDETKRRLATVGLEPVGNSPQETALVVQTEMATWGKIIRDNNIRPD